jgi:hypothetical protein
MHRDPHWEYATQYKAGEDRLLFEELMHNVLLYNHILLDNSCATKISDEMLTLLAEINRSAGYTLIERRPVAPVTVLEPVVDHVCRMLAQATVDDSKRHELSTISVPWYYRAPDHVDRPAFVNHARDWGLDPSMIPFALFVYRGLCYSGFANAYWKQHSTPTAYLAAPGRMRALAPIISSENLHLLDYPKQAYADLVDLLHLPPHGYDFSHLTSVPYAHVSELTQAIYDQSPQQAVAFVANLRNSSGAGAMREQWAHRIWNQSSSCGVGAAYTDSTVISNATIYGNVTQNIIHATPAS